MRSEVDAHGQVSAIVRIEGAVVDHLVEPDDWQFEPTPKGRPIHLARTDCDNNVTMTIAKGMLTPKGSYHPGKPLLARAALAAWPTVSRPPCWNRRTRRRACCWPFARNAARPCADLQPTYTNRMTTLMTLKTTTMRRAPLPLLIVAALAALAPPTQASPLCPLAENVARSAIQELCPVSDGLARLLFGDQWGFVDTAGRVVIAPQFDEVDNFSEGYATAKAGEKWGLIDKQGKWVVAASFDELKKFSGGLAAATRGGKAGYINAAGNWVIPAQYDWTQTFAGSVAVVRNEQRFMLIDKAGQVVKRFPDNVNLFPGHGKAGMFEAKVDDPNYIVRVDGRRQDIPPGASDVSYKDQHFIATTEVKRGDEEVQLYGLMDMTGKWVIPARFGALRPFDGKLAIASPDAGDKKEGLVNRRGAFVVQPIYERINREEDGFYRGFRGDAHDKVDILDGAGKLLFSFDCGEGNLAPAVGDLVVLAGCGKTILAHANGKVVTSMTGEVEVKSHDGNVLLSRDQSSDDNRAFAFELYDSKGQRLAASDPAHKAYGEGFDSAALLPAAPASRTPHLDVPIAMFSHYDEPSSVTLFTRDHKLITRPEWKYESEMLGYRVGSDDERLEGPMVLKGEEGFGAVDAKGDWVVPPTFSHLTPFRHGLAFGTQDGRNVVVDASGKTYPFPKGYQFSQSSYMTLTGQSDGGVVVADMRTGAVTTTKMHDGWSEKKVGGLTPVEEERKWGLMNAQQSWVVKPVFDEEPKPIMKGKQLAGWITKVNVETSTETDELYGLLDAGGREIYKPRFTSLGIDERSGLLMASENEYMRSVLDTGGKVLVAPVHADLTWLGDGWFTAKTGEQHGVVDERGEWVVKPSRFAFELKAYSKEPLQPYAVFHGGVEKAFMDLRGRVSTRAAPLDLGVPEPSQWWWHEEKRSQEGTVFYGFDFKERVRLPGTSLGAAFSEQRIGFRPFSDKYEGKLGLADDKGNVLGMYEAQDIEKMRDGMARLTRMVRRNPAAKSKRHPGHLDYVARIGYLNHAGKLAVPVVFDGRGDFSEQRATVISKGGLAMIDTKGKLVLQGTWQCGRTPVLLDGSKKIVWPEGARNVSSCKR